MVRVVKFKLNFCRIINGHCKHAGDVYNSDKIVSGDSCAIVS